jgi:hypothetical protein
MGRVQQIYDGRVLRGLFRHPVKCGDCETVLQVSHYISRRQVFVAALIDGTAEWT